MDRQLPNLVIIAKAKKIGGALSSATAEIGKVARQTSKANTTRLM